MIGDGAMVHTLVGKVAVVTGGTGGIGAGVARALAARGATVVLNGRTERKADAVLADVRRSGGGAAPPDIGNVVAFLASEDAHYLTGVSVSPTGGLTIH